MSYPANMRNADERFSCRSEAYGASEHNPLNPSAEPTLGDIINARFSRRDVLKGALGVSAIAAVVSGPLALLATARKAGAATEQALFAFNEIEHGVDQTHHVAPGYRADVLIRWGDAVEPGAPPFDPYQQKVAAQLKQFGYNNDFIGYVPLPFGSNSSEHGLLCINHEYTDEEVMFPGLDNYEGIHTGVTKEIVDIEMACNGGSISTPSPTRPTALVGLSRWTPLEPGAMPVKRTAAQLDAANPRPANLWGHIIELTPPDGDHGAEHGNWDILIKAGDPGNPEVAARWNPATRKSGWFACLDNCAIDHQGRLWISTDQGSAWRNTSGSADGIWAMECDGDLRGTGRMFFRVPVGAEMCGPCFTPDDRTLFLAVQHPATDGTKDYPGFERSSTFEDPATRWPDFDPKMPPRPSVVVVTKDDGGLIGS